MGPVGRDPGSEVHSPETRSVYSVESKGRNDRSSVWLWILLGVLYLHPHCSYSAWRRSARGHTALFWLGILFPLLWIVGALMRPTPAAAAAEARTRLR